jgi:hypothetical protein
VSGLSGKPQGDPQFKNKHSLHLLPTVAQSVDMLHHVEMEPRKYTYFIKPQMHLGWPMINLHFIYLYALDLMFLVQFLKHGTLVGFG